MSRFGGDPGPPALSADHRIAVWAPGTEVRFEKPLSVAFFVRLPMALAVFAGPAMWVAMGHRQLAEPDPTGQVAVSVVVGLVGLWLGLGNLSAALLALPERITFDWASGLLRVSGIRRSLETPLSAITAIEVRGVTVLVAERGENTMGGYTRYGCQLWAHYVASPMTPTTQALEILQTEFETEGPAAPMRQASRVASELAAALGVEHRVTDYPPA